MATNTVPIPLPLKGIDLNVSGLYLQDATGTLANVWFDEGKLRARPHVVHSRLSEMHFIGDSSTSAPYITYFPPVAVAGASYFSDLPPNFFIAGINGFTSFIGAYFYTGNNSYTDGGIFFNPFNWFDYARINYLVRTEELASPLLQDYSDFLLTTSNSGVTPWTSEYVLYNCNASNQSVVEKPAVFGFSQGAGYDEFVLRYWPVIAPFPYPYVYGTGIVTYSVLDFNVGEQSYIIGVNKQDNARYLWCGPRLGTLATSLVGPASTASYFSLAFTRNVGGSQVSVAGLSLGSVSRYNSRLFFGDLDDAKFWYSGASAVSGELFSFDLSTIFLTSRDVLEVFTVARDGGNGVDDFICFVTSRGEMAVYSGINPADPNNWQLVGRYDVGEPVRHKNNIRFFNDVLLLTSLGLVSVLACIRGGVGDSLLFENYNRVKPDIAPYIATNTNAPLWDIIYWEEKNVLLVNVVVEYEENRKRAFKTKQYVYDLYFKAWSVFEGINAYSFNLVGRDLVFVSYSELDDFTFSLRYSSVPQGTNSVYYTGFFRYLDDVQIVAPFSIEGEAPAYAYYSLFESFADNNFVCRVDVDGEMGGDEYKSFFLQGLEIYGNFLGPVETQIRVNGERPGRFIETLIRDPYRNLWGSVNWGEAEWRSLKGNTISLLADTRNTNANFVRLTIRATQTPGSVFELFRVYAKGTA